MVRWATRIRNQIILPAALVASPLLGQSYEIEDLGTLGGTLGLARGVSEDGTVVGEATDASGVKHAFLWQAGEIVDLGAPDGFTVSAGIAVNASGQVAANAEGSPQAIRAYLWEAGTWTALGVLPGQTESIAADIDPAGRIVGTSLVLGDADTRAFLWEAGALQDLGTLGGAARAEAINEARRIAGWSQEILSDESRQTRAVRWEDSAIESLGLPAGEEHGQALDVNRLGDLVGSSWHLTSPGFLSVDVATLWRSGGAQPIELGPTPGPEVCVVGFPFYTDNVARAVNGCGHVVGDAQCVASGAALAAFLWQEGLMLNLNDLVPAGSGWDLRSAQDINDAGEIVGFGIAPDGRLRGFLLRPLAPPACGLGLELDGSGMRWSAQTGAAAYDVVRGDLGLLRETGGDFSRATTACLADDHPATVLEGPPDPAPGAAVWTLVRPVGATGPGTYDSAGPGQSASRDPGVAASPDACP